MLPRFESHIVSTPYIHFLDIKGVPQFWLTVLQNNNFVGSSVYEEDEDALTYLRDIRYSELEGDSEGFTLTFHFAENPYFSNTTLTKTYHMEQDELLGELQYDHATGYSSSCVFVTSASLSFLHPSFSI